MRRSCRSILRRAEAFEADGLEPVDAAITGGDDYELLFTVRPRMRGRLRAAIERGGVAMYTHRCLHGERAWSARDRRCGIHAVAPGYTHFR